MSRLTDDPANPAGHPECPSCEGAGFGQPARGQPGEPEQPWPEPTRSRLELAVWTALAAGAVALAVGAVLLLVGAVPNSTATEVAPPFCQGRSCAGLDPDVTLCADDAVTTASAWLAGREVDLRVSTRCRAAWALLRDPRASDAIEVRGAHGDVRWQNAQGTGVRAFTPMIPDTRGEAVEACLAARDGRVCAHPEAHPDEGHP
ncbi:DUF2690 domain-containing protein [Streptomyces silvisoli]|uniref:DUF2690 domain-containing protein n=1 Tax=Streptomyces silvisoli TaxID=3034235 RepID=A0ABT5ZMP8_9ACTN|nr:DUF2690 domain-containing protein [Streptomyces silvisoli]MDF3291108.1 DUF2690 domain-containing protein [Streptomyces silvisoli]